MRTDALVSRLARDLKPAPPVHVGRRIASGLATGSIAALLLLLFGLGVRDDIVEALFSFPFWAKFIYVGPLAVGGAVATVRLARPDAGFVRWSLVLSPPLIFIASAATIGMPNISGEWQPNYWLGTSWRECPWRIALLAAPVYLGLVWPLSKLAPGRLREVGAAAGLTAGATASAIYALYCVETSPGFVSIWYSLAITIAALVGFLTAPSLLRW